LKRQKVKIHFKFKSWESGPIHKFPGEKAVFMNPLTSRKEIDIFIENICEIGSKPVR
jgi:hypothetical protein